MEISIHARCMRPLFVMATILVCRAALFAQTSYSISVEGLTTGSMITTCGEVPPRTPTVTFTGSWKTTLVAKQKGVVVTQVGGIKAAQDSTNRMYREEHLLVPIGGPDRFRVSVLDPLRQIHIKWNSDSKEAVIFHARQSQATPEIGMPQVGHEPDCQQSRPAPPLPNPEVEELGPGTIHGMEATGTRVKVVTPARPGTNKPADVTIEESWSSSNYHVEVLSLVRHGNGNYQKSELESFEDGAPDPALFEIPEGYAVRDVYEDAPPSVQNH
jgi:hypothetical protein